MPIDYQPFSKQLSRRTVLGEIELDAAYDQSIYAPLIGQILKRYASSSNENAGPSWSSEETCLRPTSVEALDLYPAKKPNEPIFVFIHGGAWLWGEAKDYGFPAELFVNAGVNYIALDFIAVGAANGDISVMADQVRRAIAWS